MKNPLAFLLRIVSIWTACAALAQAQLPFLHPLFTDNMVLQRGRPAPVWGWTTPGSSVTVTLNGQTYNATANGSGRWQVNVGPFAAGGPYTLQVTGASFVTRSNVMIGDVFLCSGQSNMEWQVNNAYNANAEAADSVNYPNIRCFTVPKVPAIAEQQTLTGSTGWKTPNANDTKQFSATAYFMAREITKQMPGVPIGILVSSWGGTQIQSWVDGPSMIADFNQSMFDRSVQAPTQDGVSQLYNGMIAPLAPFRVCGAVWYQGEFNSGRGGQYSSLLPVLKSKWRQILDEPNLPFLIIQLPNNDPVQTQPVEADNWSVIREAQQKSVAADANSRLVTTIDIGEGELHPRNKQDVGKRTAKAALGMIYGQSLVHQAPIVQSVTPSGNSLVCKFTQVGAGLMIGTKNAATPLSPVQEVSGGTLNGFAIATDTGAFYFATATITANDTVTLSSPSVTAPTRVRYAWANNPVCNLYAKITDGGGNVIDGLPAGSFRNDTVYQLNVNFGGGGGTTPSTPSTRNISANSYTGQAFSHWSGHTAAVANINAASTTVNLALPYISLRSNYTVTSAPQGFTLSPQIGQITLSWSPMALVHYKVERGLSAGGPFTTLTDSLLETSGSYVDTAVQDGVTYHYRVSAFNQTSQGPASAVLSAQPVPVVKNVAAVASADQITISWNAMTAPAASSYAVMRSNTPGGPYVTLASGLTGLSYIDRTGSPATTHYYVVAAMESGRQTPASQEVSAALPATAAPAPAVPTALAATVRHAGASASLTWQASARAASYRIKRSSSPGGPFTTVTDVQACRYDCTGLGAGNLYYYTIAAINAAGSSADTAAVTVDLTSLPAIPAAPTGLQATRGNAQVQLHWEPSTTATSYKVKRAYVVGGPFNTIATVSTPSYLNNSGINNGQPVYYLVSAVNGSGESDNSSQVLAFPQSNAVNWALRAMNNGQLVSASGTNSLIANKSSVTATEQFIRVDIDGGYIALQSIANGQYVCAESGGALPLIANRQRVGSMEKFTVIDKGNNTLGLRALTNNKVVCAEGNGAQPLIANRDNAGAWETFQIVLPSAPAMPVHFTATPEAGGIVLKWTTPAGTSGYSVKRSTSSGGPYAEIATPATAGYTDTNVAPGITYHYVVAALNGTASSPISTEVSATAAGTAQKIASADRSPAELPASWRFYHFGDQALTLAQSAWNQDPDGDGLTNWQEYLAGTHPLKADSALKIDAISASASAASITFESIDGRFYELQQTSDLSNANSWQTVLDHIRGTGASMTLDCPPPSGGEPRFYRIRLK